jgi:pectate lyase
MRRREFLAAPLALAACANVPAGRSGPSGWAATEGGIDILASDRHQFDVRSRADLDAALSLGNVPKLIRVHGRIDLSQGRGRAAFTDSAFDFDAYCKAYSPQAWGKRALEGPLEEARKRSAARQGAAVSVKIPPRTMIVGATPDAGFVSGTLMLQDTREIILQRLRFHGVRDHFPAWDPLDGAHGEWNSEYDAVSLRRAHHVWVDHCDFESEFPVTQRIFGRPFETNDGLLDITLASDLATVSWCRFARHAKTMLIGGSNRHTSDEGHLRVTLHHNLWVDCEERTPRVRFGRVHVVNNLFLPGPAYVYSIGMGVRCQIVSEDNAWEAPADFDERRIVKDWGGTRFSDHGSILNGRPLDLGGAIHRAYPEMGLDDARSFEPPPVADRCAAADVSARVRAGAGAR